MLTKMTSVILTLFLFWGNVAIAAQDGDPGDVFFTMGVHNDFKCDPASRCLPKRAPNAPSDPVYPQWWISDWTMFRVTKNYKNNPPPYTNPPATLKARDYTVSYGTSYYDANYIPEDKDGSGAMLEHYEEYCLPIFPIKDNNYTCSFISLGNKAYFLTYDKDRPVGMPQCCLFSPQNHPPRIDFIKHLPYSKARSKHLNGSVQAYALEIPAKPEKILFGYAFEKQASPDGDTTAPYRHPQSFYFSGDTSKANAPIVSQNYTSFRMQRPAAQTWDQVANMCPAQPPKCHLFDYPGTSGKSLSRKNSKKNSKKNSREEASSWADLEPPK